MRKRREKKIVAKKIENKIVAAVSRPCFENSKYTPRIRDQILNINRRIKLSYCGLYRIVNVDSGRGKILWV